MKSIPPVKAVMTAFPYWVGIDEPLERARAIMERHAIRHLPVKDGERLVSVLQEQDLPPRGAKGAARRVREVCDARAYVVGLSEPLDRVLLHMAEHGLDSALVVKEGKLAGIFTASDACLQFGRLLRSLFPSHGDDAA